MGQERPHYFSKAHAAKEKEQMPFLMIDKEKCRGDGTCVKVCPRGILAIDENANIPVPLPGAEKKCIRCGHCVAVCPTAALSLDTMPAADCASLPPDRHLSADAVSLFLKGRRSVRLYQNKPVDKEIISRLIDTARYAPSGINLQPVRWIVIQEKKRVRQISDLVRDWMKHLLAENSPLAAALSFGDIVEAQDRGRDFICRGAPHLIIAYGLKDDMTAPQAATIGLTFLDLAAVSTGLGACWAGYVTMAANAWPPLQELIGLNRRCQCLGAMMIGYPAVTYHRIPLRKPSSIQWK